MTQLQTCVGLVAPYYNLLLVIILIPLFIALLNIKHKKLILKPWKLLFIGILIYVLEELLTVLNSLNITSTPRIWTSLFEMAIITLFIYMLLLQREVAHKK